MPRSPDLQPPDRACAPTPACSPYAFGINWSVTRARHHGRSRSSASASASLPSSRPLLQLVASRMTLPPHDPRRTTTPTPRSSARWRYFLPLISIAVRRLPAGRPVHLLDHGHDLSDRPAVPHRRLGRDVPAVRLVPGVRAQSHAAVPGEAARALAGATRNPRARRILDRRSTRTSRPRRRSGPNQRRQGRRGRRR